MKRSLKTTSLSVVALLLGASALQAATEWQHPGLFTPHAAAAASQPQITFTADGLPSGQNWALVLHPSSTVIGFTVAPGYVHPLDMSQPGEPGPDQEGTLSPDDYSIADSHFAFQHLAELNESVFVIAQVPVGKAVSVVQNGSVAFHGNVTATMLLINGNPVADTSTPNARAALMLTVPSTIQQEFGPALLQNSGGGLVASTAALRRHLVSLPPIPRTLSNQQQFADAEGKAAVIIAQVQIDTTGAVTSVNLVRGNGPFAAAVSAALKNAKFKSFVQNGSAVAVSGNIQIALWKDGQVLQSNIGGV